VRDDYFGDNVEALKPHFWGLSSNVIELYLYKGYARDFVKIIHS